MGDVSIAKTRSLRMSLRVSTVLLCLSWFCDSVEEGETGKRGMTEKHCSNVFFVCLVNHAVENAGSTQDVGREEQNVELNKLDTTIVEGPWLLPFPMSHFVPSGG